MVFDKNELNLMRQWFDSVQDANHKYLQDRDYELFFKICTELNFRVSHKTVEEYGVSDTMTDEAYFQYEEPVGE